MSTDVDQLLGEFQDGDLSVRLVRGVCAVVPFAPTVAGWYSLVEGLSAIAPDAKKPVLDAAIALTRGEEAQRALTVIRSLDTADSGISVFSGVASAVKMYQARSGAERLDALETDTQQAVDAVLKGLAMAYVVYKLFPGSLTEKVDAFRKTESGQALLFYYAAIEVGLPFADNALLGGGSFVKSLFDQHGRDQVSKLAAVTSEEEAQQAAGLLEKLLGPIETMVGMASQHLGPIATAAAGYLGSALTVGDKVAGVAATGADVLPVYRFLGTRLVAEASLRRAVVEHEEVSTKKAAANPAALEVKYTRSANDLPDAPARRRGCLGLWALVLAVGGGGLAAIASATWSLT